MADAFNDANEGIVMAFRRSESPLRAADFELRGIDRNAEYTIENLDTGAKIDVSGATLADGFTVELAQKRSSAVLIYTKK